MVENTDGSICAHIPVSWVRIIPPREYTDEQRQQMADAMRRNILDKESTRTEKGIISVCMAFNVQIIG